MTIQSGPVRVRSNGDRYVGMGLLMDRYESALNMHWRTVLRVMVHPKYQGSGAGTALMTGCGGARRTSGSSSCN